MRILREICGCRRKASVMLCVPLPPENNTTLICDRAGTFSAARLESTGATLAFITGMSSPQKLFQCDGVLRGVYADCFFHAHDARRQDYALTGGQGDDRQQVKFASAVSGSGRGSTQLPEQPYQYSGPKTEKAGITLSPFRHRVALARLFQSGNT